MIFKTDNTSAAFREYEKAEKKKDEKVATLIKCLQSNEARENEINKIDMILKPTEMAPTLKIGGFEVKRHDPVVKILETFKQAK
jgi:hypothetical protein